MAGSGDVRDEEQIEPIPRETEPEASVPGEAPVEAEAASAEAAPVVQAGDPVEEDVRVTGAHPLRAWVRDLVVSVVVSAFIIIFLYQPVRVEGTSMNPGLEDQDRLFVNKMAFHVGEVHRGDVVVFLYPHDHQKSYIKRVIALPGDRVRIDHGRVYVNNTRIAEPYVPARFADDRSQPELALAATQYFVMGDRRSISSDSRDFGPVTRDLIYGKAAFVYWPVDQAGVVR